METPSTELTRELEETAPEGIKVGDIVIWSKKFDADQCATIALSLLKQEEVQRYLRLTEIKSIAKVAAYD